MKRDKAWFEMEQLRRRKLDKAVWIPLRSVEYFENVGRYGDFGHVQDFYGVGSVAIPLGSRGAANKLGWMDAGIIRSHRPFVENSQYVPADQFQLRGEESVGTHLVMENDANGAYHREWLIHPDLILGFGLVAEGDSWVSPADGFETVIELRRNESGAPIYVGIKSEYLKDYLAAREAALFVTSYRDRRVVVEHAAWQWDKSEWEDKDGVRWEGRVTAIHEGGMPFGEHTAVFHVAHKNFDREVDVPLLPHPVDGQYDSEEWTIEDQGRKLFVVRGEMWKDEWVEPGLHSPRIRGDSVPSTTTFTIEASGRRVAGDQLLEDGRWLWFRPDVIPAIAHRRGGRLEWYTRFTGGVTCVPSSRVHFGINKLGLVNVYAKDIGYLPEWQQRIWAGFNVTPDGGVSDELQSAQVGGEPADTLAAEAFLSDALKRINQSAIKRYSEAFVREHDQLANILERTHRFRAVDEQGLFALAKDLARVTADIFDVQNMKSVLALSSSDKIGSLKCVERILARDIGDEEARKVMGPLFGIYDLRLGDAHLPRKDLDAAFALAGVNRDLPLVHQAGQLVDSCVSALYHIAHVIEHKATILRQP